MLVVELLHGGLNARESIERLEAARRIRINNGGAGEPLGRRGEMGRALGLDAIELDVQVANLCAKVVLFRDARFEATDIEGNDVGASGSKRGRQRVQKRKTLFE